MPPVFLLFRAIFAFADFISALSFAFGETARYKRFCVSGHLRHRSSENYLSDDFSVPNAHKPGQIRFLLCNQTVKTGIFGQSDRFSLKSREFAGAETAKKRFLLRKAGFSGAKTPWPDVHAVGGDERAKALPPSRAPLEGQPERVFGCVLRLAAGGEGCGHKMRRADTLHRRQWSATFPRRCRCGRSLPPLLRGGSIFIKRLSETASNKRIPAVLNPAVRTTAKHTLQMLREGVA